jgi:hypothetical protein
MTTTANPETEARRLEQQAQDLRAQAETDRLAAVAEREERTRAQLAKELDDHDPTALRHAVVNARANLLEQLRTDPLGAALLAYECAMRRERTANDRASGIAARLGLPHPQAAKRLRTGAGNNVRGYDSPDGMDGNGESGFMLRELTDVLTEHAESLVTAERQAHDAELSAAITDGGRLNGAKRTRAERDAERRKTDQENRFMVAHGIRNAADLTGNERAAAITLANERKAEADERLRDQQRQDRAEVRLTGEQHPRPGEGFTSLSKADPA